jgi:hypothetical protein
VLHFRLIYTAYLLHTLLINWAYQNQEVGVHFRLEPVLWLFQTIKNKTCYTSGSSAWNYGGLHLAVPGEPEPVLRHRSSLFAALRVSLGLAPKCVEDLTFHWIEAGFRIRIH